MRVNLLLRSLPGTMSTQNENIWHAARELIDRRRLNQLTLYRKIKINSQKTKNNSQNFPAPRRPRHAPMSTNHSSHWACYIPKYLEICKIAAIHSGCALRAPKFSHNVNSKTHHSFMQPGRKIDTKLNTGTLYRLNRMLFSWSQIWSETETDETENTTSFRAPPSCSLYSFFQSLQRKSLAGIKRYSS